VEASDPNLGPQRGPTSWSRLKAQLKHFVYPEHFPDMKTSGITKTDEPPETLPAKLQDNPTAENTRNP
jgi:hypothetical protein